MEQRGAEYGHTSRSRDRWRLVGPMHLAETAEQAIEDVRYGLDDWADYTQHVLAAPHLRAAGSTFAERVAWVNDAGLGVIGTPDDGDRADRAAGGAVRRVRPYLLMHHEWARLDATARSYELFARHVMPHFQGTAERLRAAAEYARSRWRSWTRRTAMPSGPRRTGTPPNAAPADGQRRGDGVDYALTACRRPADVSRAATRCAVLPGVAAAMSPARASRRAATWSAQHRPSR